MYKVSVIIPVYNVEKYLEKCLTSLVNQTLKDIEIICVNDGSKDSSLEILEKFAKADKRIRIFSIDNSGISVVRNLGIENATGEYIGFVDSDDWVDLDYFEKMYNTAKKYNADVACAGYKRNKKIKSKIRKKFQKEILTNDVNQKLELDNVPKQPYVWNKIYKRESWLKAGLRFPEKRIYEDIAIILKIHCELGSMVTVPDTYYNYIKRKNSLITVTNDKTLKDSEFAYKEMLKYAKLNGIKLKPLKNNYRKLYVNFLGIRILKINYYQQKIKIYLFNFIPIITVHDIRTRANISEISTEDK